VCVWVNFLFLRGVCGKKREREGGVVLARKIERKSKKGSWELSVCASERLVLDFRSSIRHVGLSGWVCWREDGLEREADSYG